MTQQFYLHNNSNYRQKIYSKKFYKFDWKNITQRHSLKIKKKKKKWLQNDSGSDYKRHNTVEFFVMFEIEVYNRKTSDKAITFQWFLDVLLRSIVIYGRQGFSLFCEVLPEAYISSLRRKKSAPTLPKWKVKLTNLAA